MIYLDNSATTALSENVKIAMQTAMELYGNPSSLHSVGDIARRKLAEQRATIMSAFGAKNGKLIFTSCGSEATALALIGAAKAKQRIVSNRIITTDSEHPSVANSLASLEKLGFEIIKISTRCGKLDESEIEAALNQPIFLATAMLVNNETGAVYNISDMFKRIKSLYPSAICHCDAVQGFLKIPFTPTTLNADLITVSAHKIHGPKGVGALWVDEHIIKEKRLVPILLGGGQENGFRSGTENTIGISGFAAAVEEGMVDFSHDSAHMSSLRAYAIDKLMALGKEVSLNIPEVAAPHILSVTVKGIKSQTILNSLSAKGICVSSGSACSSHFNKPSSTLLAFGLNLHEADSTIRISLSKYNTQSDIDALASALHESVKALVHFK